jgi:hypothetical protein
MVRTLLALLFVSGCCKQVDPCPEHAVAILVTEDGASVPGVTVEGDLALSCAQDDEAGVTTCTPDDASVPEGDYAFTVSIEGRDPVDVTLEVRTLRPPPFSCECAIPEASETIELEPLEPQPEPDAGA